MEHDGLDWIRLDTHDTHIGSQWNIHDFIGIWKLISIINLLDLVLLFRVFSAVLSCVGFPLWPKASYILTVNKGDIDNFWGSQGFNSFDSSWNQEALSWICHCNAMQCIVSLIFFYTSIKGKALMTACKHYINPPRTTYLTFELSYQVFLTQFE